MLLFVKKSGGGINGSGIFDFGKILLKKALNSNLIQTASKAINSELGQTAISAVKRAAQSELGQELQKRAISEVRKRVRDVSDKALDKIALPSEVKRAAQSELGQAFQKKLISQVGKTAQQFSPSIAGKAENITQSAFQKLGLAAPKKPPSKRKRRGKKRKGGEIYPQGLLKQFGSGIVLE